MQQLDDQLKRATANAVYWMKRYYNFRLLVEKIISEPTVDDYKAEHIYELIKNEKHQDVLNDPNGSKQETNKDERGQSL